MTSQFEMPIKAKRSVHALDGVEFRLYVERYSDVTYVGMQAVDIRDRQNPRKVIGFSDYWKENNETN